MQYQCVSVILPGWSLVRLAHGLRLLLIVECLLFSHLILATLRGDNIGFLGQWTIAERESVLP